MALSGRILGKISMANEKVLSRVLGLISKAGGKPYLVGGCVRDLLWQKPVHDLDIEVFGLQPEKLMACLQPMGDLDPIGKSFGVLMVPGAPIEISIPRRERKTGLGHRSFEIDSDPNMTFEEACSRRDFTMNAMLMDPFSGEIVDPFNGQKDMTDGILRHVSDRFKEDPLRVLRGAQFMARFELKAAQETIEICQTIGMEKLSKERVFLEFKKLILHGVRPGLGFHFLNDVGWLWYFPELQAMVGTPQNPEYHPEGDVFVHTCHVLDAFAKDRIGDEKEDLIVGLACLCHDLGKPLCTQKIKGVWRSPQHEVLGLEPSKAFLDRLTNQEKLIQQILPLVRFHLAPFFFHKNKVKNAAIRRLARNVGRLDRLVRVSKADHLGRPPLTFERFVPGEWLLQRARELKVDQAKPQPLILGRHLMQLGLSPGPEFKDILATCFEAQIDGTFSTLEEGLDKLPEIVKSFK